jgi:ParB-like chromosome segregation protein Spo0J
MELEINRELQGLIPALSKPEQDALIASLSAEGCRQPITVWRGKNIIVDGHNRYAICNKLDIPFKVEKLEFKDEARVKIWIINNQLARRNLSIEYRVELACTLAAVEQELAQKRKLANLKQFSDSPKTAETSGSTDSLTRGLREEVENTSINIKGKTLEKVAKKAGISRATVERYDAIKRKGTEEQKEAIRTGKKKIGTVYKEIQAKEKPTSKPQSNECDIEKLLKGKTIKTPYLLLYSKQDKETGEEMRAYLSNCELKANLHACRDFMMESVHGKCHEDDFVQSRISIRRMIEGVVFEEGIKNAQK